MIEDAYRTFEVYVVSKEDGVCHKSEFYAFDYDEALILANSIHEDLGYDLDEIFIDNHYVTTSSFSKFVEFKNRLDNILKSEFEVKNGK